MPAFACQSGSENDIAVDVARISRIRDRGRFRDYQGADSRKSCFRGWPSDAHFSLTRRDISTMFGNRKLGDRRIIRSDRWAGVSSEFLHDPEHSVSQIGTTLTHVFDPRQAGSALFLVGDSGLGDRRLCPLPLCPPWDQVTKDDDVRFFPRNYPSVIGQELLERGFPRDAASSQLVLVYERPDGPLTSSDFTVVEERASEFHRFGQSNPDLGIKKIDTHRSPVIGPRLIGKSDSGPGQAVLTIVSLRGTYLSKKTRIAVNRILDYLQKGPPCPRG